MYICIYSYHGMILKSNKEQTTDTCKNMKESQKQIVLKKKKPDTKCYIHVRFIYSRLVQK